MSNDDVMWWDQFECKPAKVYYDLVSDDKLLIDYDFHYKDPKEGHGFKEHVNGMIWEVEGKRAKQFQSFLVPEYPEYLQQDDVLTTFPLDLVCFNDVYERDDFDEETLTEHIEKYIEDLEPKLRSDRMEQVRKNKNDIIGFFVDKLEGHRIFSGMNGADGSLVFQDIDNPTTLLYWAFGLRGFERYDLSLQFGTDIPMSQETVSSAETTCRKESKKRPLDDINVAQRSPAHFQVVN